MGYSPGFVLKIGQFRTLANSPETTQTIPQAVRNIFASIYDAFLRVSNYSWHLPKFAIVKIMGYSPGFLLRRNGATLASSAMRQIGYLLFHYASTAPRFTFAPFTSCHCVFQSFSSSSHVFHLRRVLRSATFSSRVFFNDGNYIWHTVERCEGVRGSWNNQTFILQHFRSWPKSICAKICHRSLSHEGLGPYPGPGLTSSLRNRFDYIVRVSRGIGFARFVTSSFGSRCGAVRTRCAKLLVWKVERLSR